MSSTILAICQELFSIGKKKAAVLKRLASDDLCYAANCKSQVSEVNIVLLLLGMRCK
jgi:hypothetical protein